MTPCCGDVRLLERFADGECSNQEAANLTKHLPSCESCREEVRVLRALSVELSQTLEESPLGEGMVDRLMESIADATGASMNAMTPASSYAHHVEAASAALDSRRQHTSATEPTPLIKVPTPRLSPLSWLLPVAACVATAFGLKLLDRPLPPPQPQQSTSPTIAQWQGQESGAVLQVRQAGADFQPAIRGHALAAGAELWNRGRIATFIDLSDGSRVALSPGAKLRLAAADRVDVISTQGASIFCEVTPRQQGRRPFTVTSDNTTITVLGTRFTVRSSSRAVRVTVLEGRVRISSPLEMRELGPGEAATVDDSAGRIDRAPAKVRDAVSWIPGYEGYQPPTGSANQASDAASRPPAQGGARDLPGPADGDADMPVVPPGRKR